MKKVYIISVFCIASVILLISCSGVDNRVKPEEFLPETISSLGIERASDPIIFRGDSLTYYTNEAEFYQRFNFVDMATADYSKDDITLEIEVFRFASPEDAYGIYSHLRWGQSEWIVPLGVEGFRHPPNTYFVKGPYVVHVMGFDDSEIPQKALDDLATYYAEDMPGDTTLPEKFALFPDEGMLAGSAMYFPDQFLRMDFMKCVYGCYCMFESDTVFLALSCDSAGPKVLEWSKLVEDDSTFQSLPADIPYDDSKGFTYSSRYYGRVMIGVKSGIMAAVLGYEDRHKQFLTDWINSLPDKTI
jgi:hypothetical protein